jgi:hypothetical protein
MGSVDSGACINNMNSFDTIARTCHNQCSSEGVDRPFPVIHAEANKSLDKPSSYNRIVANNQNVTRRIFHNILQGTENTSRSAAVLPSNHNQVWLGGVDVV